MDENELSVVDYTKLAVGGVAVGATLVMAAIGWKHLVRDITEIVNEKIDAWEKEL